MSPRSARFAALALWICLAAVFVVWGLLVWHPWIDWFGDPQR